MTRHRRRYSPGAADAAVARAAAQFAADMAAARSGEAGTHAVLDRLRREELAAVGPRPPSPWRRLALVAVCGGLGLVVGLLVSGVWP